MITAPRMTFFEAFAIIKKAWPDRPYDWAFHLATIEEAGLPCEHPVTLRELSPGGGKVIRCVDTASRYRRQQLESGELVTYCPVCHTWNPKEPVDTIAKRSLHLAVVLLCALRDEVPQ